MFSSLHLKVSFSQEVSLPDVFSLDNLVPGGITSRTEAPSDEFNDQQKNRHILITSDHAGPSAPVSVDLSNMVVPTEQMNIDLLQSDAHLPPRTSDCDIICTSVPIENSHGDAGFLEVDQVLPNMIRAPTVQSSRKIVLLYRDCPLQLFCTGMMIHFGVKARFKDYAGRPKLNIVVGAPENLCKVLDICDQVAQVSSQNSGSNSKWLPVLQWLGHSNTFTIRLQ